MENQENIVPQQEENPSEKQNKGGGGKFIGVVLVISILANAFLFYLYWQNKNKVTISETAFRELKLDKDSLQNELDQFKSEFEKLKADNQETESQLTEAQAQIELKVAEIQRLIKSGDPVKLAQARNEIARLTRERDTYAQQIDSLRKTNAEYLANNQNLKQEITSFAQKTDSLARNNEVLKEKVTIGSKIMVTGLRALGVKEKKNAVTEMTRASRTDKLKVSFKVLANPIAEPGEREIIIRILGPSKEVLTNLNPDLQDKKQLFSIKQKIDYTQSTKEIELFYKQEAPFKAGNYNVELWMEDEMVQKTSFSLK